MAWPQTAEELIGVQKEMAAGAPEPGGPVPDPARYGACFVCFARGGAGPGGPRDPGWAGAALWRRDEPPVTATVGGRAAAGYEAGLLALREGELLERALLRLPMRPDVLLANSTGRDHPRRAGLALHLGAVLDVPSVGVTHRPLMATGPWPADEAGATSPLHLEGVLVGYWLRTRPEARPLAIHAGWRTGPEEAVRVVVATVRLARTPEPLRWARRAAREARAAATGHPRH